MLDAPLLYTVKISVYLNFINRDQASFICEFFIANMNIEGGNCDGNIVYGCYGVLRA